MMASDSPCFGTPKDEVKLRMWQEAWPQVSEPPVLDSGEVHVWRFELDQPAEVTRRLELWLSPEERARAARLRLPRLQHRFIVGRGMLRMLLGRYLDHSPEALRFEYGVRGKPELVWPKQLIHLHFNLAHSGQRALLAVSREQALGVDIELLRPVPKAQEIVHHFFSPGEIAEFLEVPEEQRSRAFFLGWTRKEAYLKATGGGLAGSLASFEVTLAPDRPPALVRVVADPEEASHWFLDHLEPGPGFVGALAIRGLRPRLRMLEATAPSAGF